MRNILKIASWSALALTARVAPAADLYPGDATKDSAPGIAERARRGEPIPAGVYFCLSTIDTGTHTGGALIGNGAQDFARGEGWHKNGPACTQIVDARERDNAEPLLKVNCPCFRIENIALTGCRVGRADYHSGRGAGPLIEITQLGNPWPVGHTSLRNVTLTNSEIGILHSQTPGTGGHSDHTHAVRLFMHAVDYPIILDDNQSVDHQLDLTVTGTGKVVIWAKDGGKLTARIHTNFHTGGGYDELLRLGNLPDGVVNGDGKKPPAGATFPTSNNGYYRLTLDMDGDDRLGTSVREMVRYQYSLPVVEIDGFAPHTAAVGDPVLLNEPNNVSIHIRKMFPNGDIRWPR